jgi:hypothetical protein
LTPGADLAAGTAVTSILNIFQLLRNSVVTALAVVFPRLCLCSNSISVATVYIAGNGLGNRWRIGTCHAATSNDEILGN